MLYTFHCHKLKSTDDWTKWFAKQPEIEHWFLRKALVFDLIRKHASSQRFLKMTEAAVREFF